jgi:eukaryotic-like serine/threonine-protein kinase
MNSTASNATPLIGQRYLLGQTLGKGGMGVVYLATDKLTGTAVALKQVVVNTQHLNFASRADAEADERIALSKEFQTLASVRHPRIIRVLDYGFDQAQAPFFTMAYLEGATSITNYGRNLPVSAKIELIVQVLEALEYLHRRGILHRDLKPSNILVLPTGEVKVLDFGLALAADQANQVSFAGTVAYAAPELLRGGQPSIASDLYAVGLIAYELLAGYYPFGPLENVRMADLIHRIDSQPLNLSQLPRNSTDVVQPSTVHLMLTDSDDDTTIKSLAEAETDQSLAAFASTTNSLNEMLLAPTNADLRPSAEAKPATEAANNADLSEVVAQLANKKPNLRHSSARAAINDLYRVLALPPRQDQTLRDSFLQAAKPIGREKELQQLQGQLEAARRGHGSLWLVGGESGIGKTRLLEELAIRALVSNVLVLRGEMIAEDGGEFYLWRAPLRRLAITGGIAEAELATLRGIVPDLATLSNFDAAGLPSQHGMASPEAIEKAIVQVFSSQKQPILLLLEDLHWAEESLKPLHKLAKLAATCPLLVVGSYRNDERPELATAIAGSQNLTLARFSRGQIAELSTAMIGERPAATDIVNLLEAETEGNAFFLVETLRALAEDLGSLDQIGVATLPARIIAGGVQQIVARRLGRVQQAYLPLLRAAAVFGREMNLPLLAAMSAQPGLDPGIGIEAWLEACASVAVLEASEAKWRFSHDKLREGLLAAFSQEDRIFYYRTVAESIEAITQGENNIRKPYNAQLYQLWGVAQDSLRQFRYSHTQSSDHVRHSRFREAIAHIRIQLDTAQTLDPTDTLALVRDQKAQLFTTLGDAEEALGNYEGARQAYLDALPLMDKDSKRAATLNGLGIIYAHLGQLDQTRHYFEEALRMNRASGALDSVSSSLSNLGVLHYQLGQLDLALDYYQQGLAVAQQVNDEHVISRTLQNLASISLDLGKEAQGRAYAGQALALYQQTDDLQGMASINELLSVIARVNKGYDLAAKYAKESLRIAEQTGDRYLISLACDRLALVCLAQGNLTEAASAAGRALQIATEMGNEENLPLYRYTNARVCLANGDTATAKQHLTAGLQSAHQSGMVSNLLINLLGFAELALAHGNGQECAALLQAILSKNHADYALNSDYIPALRAKLDALALNSTPAPEPLEAYISRYLPPALLPGSGA